jgi:hypothetical protein
MSGRRCIFTIIALDIGWSSRQLHATAALSPEIEPSGTHWQET